VILLAGGDGVVALTPAGPSRLEPQVVTDIAAWIPAH
jgi:hypothetical protein